MEYLRPLEPILIIDDDRSMCNDLIQILTDLGFDQINVNDDMASVETSIKEIEPCVIFVGIALPDSDGCDVISQLTGLNPNSKIILCADLLSLENVETNWEFGADEYISKPYSANKIDMIMKRIELS